jgi:hypothetical protein
MLVGGGFLSTLPLFGLWMLPLGPLLLAEDVPPLRYMRNHLLDELEQRRPPAPLSLTPSEARAGPPEASHL